ncbi:ABC-three component system middle component 6 [Caulobacter segnis]|uniref:ABC-three component system middle component 6 n=1 Tax=Caulobacter segnis TaxID=88688 RepID=UPI002864B673|nr:ABC-three component system middle component 6 [Caulobacter segnis]MDR6624475.1 hypothetical protein [Caulobacter segnis]
MILPTRNIAPDRALLTVSGEVFQLLAQPETVSSLWDRVRGANANRPIAYSWFLLAVDLLFTIGLVNFDEQGLLARSLKQPS